MIKIGSVFVVFAILSLIPSNVPAVPAGQTVTWEGGGQGPVKFEGAEHSKEGYKCDSCHPALFQMKKNSAKMTMELLNKGRFCGACHNGKAAFSTSNPRKCHECHKKRKKHHDSDGKHHDD